MYTYNFIDLTRYPAAGYLANNFAGYLANINFFKLNFFFFHFSSFVSSNSSFDCFNFFTFLDLNNIVAIANNIYNFVYTATGYPDIRQMKMDIQQIKSDIRQIKPVIRPDIEYKKGRISG